MPPSLDYHHHLQVFVSNDVWDGLKTPSIQAYIGNVLTVCRPVGRPHWYNLLHAAIVAELGSEDILIKLY